MTLTATDEPRRDPFGVSDISGLNVVHLEMAEAVAAAGPAMSRSSRRRRRGQDSPTVEPVPRSSLFAGPSPRARR